MEGGWTALVQHQVGDSDQFLLGLRQVVKRGNPDAVWDAIAKLVEDNKRLKLENSVLLTRNSSLEDRMVSFRNKTKKTKVAKINKRPSVCTQCGNNDRGAHRSPPPRK